MFDISLNHTLPVRTGVSGGDVVGDMTDAADGDLNIAAGQTVTVQGNGLDFSQLTADPAAIRGPVGALGNIYATQEFLVVGWFKMPSSVLWNSGPSIFSMFTTTATQGGYAAPEIDMLTINQHHFPAFQARRQTNGGSTIEKLEITNLNDFYGQVCQFAYWRTAAGSGLRLKSVLGEQTVSGISGADNTGDFTGNLPRWGVTESWNNVAAALGHDDAHNFRAYRGFIEDLNVSGRAPAAVIDLDWNHVQTYEPSAKFS